MDKFDLQISEQVIIQDLENLILFLGVSFFLLIRPSYNFSVYNQINGTNYSLFNPFSRGWIFVVNASFLIHWWFIKKTDHEDICRKKRRGNWICGSSIVFYIIGLNFHNQMAIYVKQMIVWGLSGS